MPVSEIPPHIEAEITAALIWDLPTLRGGSESARSFAAALQGAPDSWWESNDYGHNPLGRAARAVAVQRGGDSVRALPLFQEMAEAEENSEQLLGLMLLAWSELGNTVDAIERAREVAAASSIPEELGARLEAKMATYALDAGEHALALDALGRAVDLAPIGTRLRMNLAMESLNAGLGPTSYTAFPDENSPPPDDSLTDYPWIHYEALHGAQSGLIDGVERGAERLWSWKIRFGGTTPLEETISAEVQATWAGALWHRRKLRHQLGAQLLSGEATQAPQWGYGVLMWTLGGGKNPEQIFNFAEPHMDQQAVDYLIRNLHNADWQHQRIHQFASVAAEAWDVVSDSTLRWLVEILQPNASDHPTAVAINRVWAGYAARLPTEWIEKARTEPPEVQVALLSMLNEEVLTRFPAGAREHFGRLLIRSLRAKDHPDGHLLRLASKLVPDDVRPDLTALIAERATPEALGVFMDSGSPDVVPTSILVRARDRVVRSLQQESADAQEGKVSFGSGDTRITLARLLVAMPRDEDAVQALSVVASDPSLPGEHIVAARNGLALLRYQGKLTAAQTSRWHDVPDPRGTFPEHGGASDELAKIRRLQILALELTTDEGVEVIMSTRSTDRRVRIVAVQVASEAAQAEAASPMRDGFVWALIGALWDPQDDVVATAVWALGPELSSDSAASTIAFNRLPRLFELGNTEVRLAIAEITAKYRQAGPVAQSILENAIADKSWRVREAADAAVRSNEE